MEWQNNIYAKGFLFSLLLLLWVFNTCAQQAKKKISLRDSLDNAFDLSDYIIESNGFVPVPIIITEPAVGGFGGGVIPLFIKKRAPYIDFVNGYSEATG